jgi:phosphoribosylanthranilate isomerase
MRSIPVARAGARAWVPTLDLAARLAPFSDFFLTDTWLGPSGQNEPVEQPVQGFVGITGQTSNWDMVADLVRATPVPVILAGGIGPDNVDAALRRTLPAGIDSCTATNAVDAGGRPVRFAKDPEKVRRLVEAVRRAQEPMEAHGLPQPQQHR